MLRIPLLGLNSFNRDLDLARTTSAQCQHHDRDLPRYPYVTGSWDSIDEVCWGLGLGSMHLRILRRFAYRICE
jgi:adenylosuccinate synthase